MIIAPQGEYPEGDSPLGDSLVTFSSGRKSPGVGGAERPPHRGVQRGRQPPRIVKKLPPGRSARWWEQKRIQEKGRDYGKEKANRSHLPQDRREGLHRARRRGDRSENYRYARKKLYALRDERHRLARDSGNRRLQAFPPQAAVHHVQDGPADRLAHQIRQRGRDDDEA